MHSKAIKNVLEKYNHTVAALNPPQQYLHWNDVIEYVFLAEFNLLQDAHQDIHSKPWATPAGCMTLDMYQKIEWAEEEIIQLNIEICCFLAYIHNEDTFI